jgi:uncharacterized phage protein gp47/JayE
VAGQSKVTNFVVGGVARSILAAVAGVIAEVWNDITGTKRSLFIDTAQGADLDTIGNRRGVPRKGATAGSVVVVFNGPVEQFIPTGTQIRATIGNTIYQTMHDVTIGAKNVALNGLALSTSLSDSVVAESLLAGSQVKVPAGVMTQLVTPIAGVSATNPAPSMGGEDAESDDLYADRMKNIMATLNQGTQAFFEATAKEVEPTVLRALALRDTNTRGVRIVLAKDSGATYSDDALTTIASGIAAQSRGADIVTCENISFTGISVAYSTYLPSGVAVSDVFRAVADAIANYLDFRTWAWGQGVADDSLLAVIKTVANGGDIDLATFTVNGALADASVGSESLPRFVNLSITDTRTSTTAGNSLTQSYAGQA